VPFHREPKDSRPRGAGARKKFDRLRLRDVDPGQVFGWQLPRVATDLPVGSAKGSLTYDGATAELKFAAAFVDQKDERKRIVPVISDQKLPLEKSTYKGFLLLPSNC
jgi:hypothetical protein